MSLGLLLLIFISITSYYAFSVVRNLINGMFKAAFIMIAVLLGMSTHHISNMRYAALHCLKTKESFVARSYFFDIEAEFTPGESYNTATVKCGSFDEIVLRSDEVNLEDVK